MPIPGSHTRPRTLTLMTVLLLLIGLVACGNTTTTTTSTPVAQEAATPETDVAAAPTAANTATADTDDHADDEHADDEHADDEHADDEHADDEHADDEHADDEHADATIAELVAALQPIPAGETLDVIATTTIVGDVVSQVGGDAINLTTLFPVGADPHTFEPTPQDIALISEADVVFINGLGLEEALTPLIENSGIAPEQIIPVSVGIETLEFAGDHDEDMHDHEGEEPDHDSTAEPQGNLLDWLSTSALAQEEHDHEHTGADPHTWMSPLNVMVWTDNIAATLSALDPANAEIYSANAATYTAELTELDTFIREQIDQIPPEQRQLVTDHTAFGYFAHEYGLEQIGAIIPGYSTMAEASAQELAELQEAIAQYDVPAIFVGTTVNDAMASQVANDTGVQLLPIYTGSLSAPDGPADSYIALMRYNTAQFVQGLAGR